MTPGDGPRRLSSYRSMTGLDDSMQTHFHKLIKTSLIGSRVHPVNKRRYLQRPIQHDLQPAMDASLMHKRRYRPPNRRKLRKAVRKYYNISDAGSACATSYCHILGCKLDRQLVQVYQLVPKAVGQEIAAGLFEGGDGSLFSDPSNGENRRCPFSWWWI